MSIEFRTGDIIYIPEGNLIMTIDRIRAMDKVVILTFPNGEQAFNYIGRLEYGVEQKTHYHIKRTEDLDKRIFEIRLKHEFLY